MRILLPLGAWFCLLCTLWTPKIKEKGRIKTWNHQGKGQEATYFWNLAQNVPPNRGRRPRRHLQCPQVLQFPASQYLIAFISVHIDADRLAFVGLEGVQDVESVHGPAAIDADFFATVAVL